MTLSVSELADSKFIAIAGHLLALAMSGQLTFKAIPVRFSP